MVYQYGENCIQLLNRSPVSVHRIQSGCMVNLSKSRVLVLKVICTGVRLQSSYNMAIRTIGVLYVSMHTITQR